MENEIEKLEEVYSSESDSVARKLKAGRIIRIIENYDSKAKSGTCLEIGTGPGIMSEVFNNYFDFFTSIDLHDIRLNKNANYSFSRANSEKLPFINGQYDLVIFNHVYQYLGDKNSALSEIARIMKDDGICYFTTSNRFALVEPHFSLPFLGYLPARMANLYLGIFTGKYSEYNISSEGYCSLCSRLGRYFDVEDITVELLKNHNKYDFSDIPAVKYLAGMPRFLLDILKISVFTNWVFILKNRQTQQ